MVQFTNQSIPGITFFLLGIPLLISDAFRFYLPPVLLALQAIFTISSLFIFHPQEILLRTAVALGVFLLFTGLWFIMQDRFGYGDVLVVTIMAWAVDPIIWYLVMTWTCIMAFLYFGYLYLMKHNLHDIRLPFVSLLVLGFWAVHLI